jgi:hypothetical protein
LSCFPSCHASLRPIQSRKPWARSLEFKLQLASPLATGNLKIEL